MKLAWETLVAAVLIAASILFIGRYQISTSGVEYASYMTVAVYRLDRWTGKVDMCDRDTMDGNISVIKCPAKDPSAQQAK